MVARLGFSIRTSRQIKLPQLFELVRLAEQLEYESVWIPETWSLDAVSLLAALCLKTSTIKLASGVLNVYSRSAALIAQTSATLKHLSSGRFILGLGASGPAVIQDWHGMAYRRPVERTREFLEVVKLTLSGQRVNYSGKQLNLHGFRLTDSSGDEVPIYLAALGPKNIKLAGELADGWLPIFAARSKLSPLFEHLRAGAAAAMRDPDRIDVAAYVPALLGPRAEDLLKGQIAYYVGGMGTFYASHMSRLGFAGSVDRIRTAWQAGNRVAAAAAVDEDLLETCSLGPTAAEAVARIEEYRSEGVSLPVITPPEGATTEEVADMLQRLAPKSLSLATDS